jgi:hypothetical protein
MAMFYLADIPRRQFDELPIRLPDAQMQKDVEAKAGLVLVASDRFGDTVELGNIYWATAAGYRLADMQKNFWTALVKAPIPPHLGADASALYVEEVHRQSLSLLEKALSIHQRNVKLATVYKSSTPWSEASEREAIAITELIGREQAGDLVRAGELALEDAPVSASRRDYVPARLDL